MNPIIPSVRNTHDHHLTRTRSWVVLSLLGLSSAAMAADYYVEPPQNSASVMMMKSASAPTQTIQALLNSGKLSGNDRIFMSSGDHGSIVVSKAPPSTVLIQAQAGHKPSVRGIQLAGAKNMHFKGLTIAGGGVTIEAGSDNNIIEDCSFDTAMVNASSTLAKSAASMSAALTPSRGVSIYSSNNTLRNLHISNGGNILIAWGAYNNKVIGCLVENMSSDGIHSQGSGSIIEYNTVRNPRLMSAGHHYDLIQAYGSNGKIRFNKLVAYTNPNQPYICRQAQGIGMFDGYMKNWVIEGNDVRVDHPIGIWCHGVENFTVINNRVGLIGSPVMRSLPSIAVNNSKGGRPSKNCIVTGNIAPAYRWNVEGVNTVATVGNNIISRNPPPAGGGPVIPPTHDTQAPSAPKLSGSAQSSNTIILSWTAATDNVGVVGYEVFRGTTLLNTITGTTFSDTGLTAKTLYTYTVKAKDASSNRASSNTITITTTSAPSTVPDTTTPSIPVLSCSVQSSSSIKLSWTTATDNIGVVGYEVLRGTTLLGTVTATIYTDTGLSPNTRYTYTVKAKDAANNRSSSSAITVSTSADSTTPPPPTVAEKRYEAEKAVIKGANKEDTYVDLFADTGAYVEWTVNTSAAGNHKVMIQYALASGADRPMSLSVNNAIVKSALSMPNTGSWTKWKQTTAVMVSLKAGANKIRLTSTGLGGGRIDWLGTAPAAPVGIASILTTDLILGSWTTSTK